MLLPEMRTRRSQAIRYDTRENSIPFLHRHLAAAYFTSLSLPLKPGNLSEVIRGPSVSLRQNEKLAFDLMAGVALL
jgi:hypothetical protein